jgi:small nuclear ribonucleoprotein (snRNP)-like protein
MVRRGLSLGLFGRFGRSAELRQFDGTLRSVDLHPNLVPEAVKLTAVTVLADHVGNTEPDPQSYRAAAEIIAYCMIGADAFASSNSQALADEVERRIDAAFDSGASLDAKLVLLALHARVVQPSVVETFQLGKWVRW